MTLETLIRGPKTRALALVAVIAALIVLLWQSDEPVQPMEAAKLRGEAEPDAFVVGGRFLSFRETGQLAMRIKSERIEQFEKDSIFEMQQPRATLFGETDDATWKLDAKQGRLLETTGMMYLTGDVEILRLSDERGPLSLSTAALTLDNDKRTAYTAEPVRISDPLGITRATGMKVWIDERILELNAQVEGRYEPGK
jgi:lipopolysaccharide export system protein LptC